jgi:ERCC4-type nuclease
VNVANANDVLFPHAILIDRREKAPYSFTGFFSDAHQENKPLRVLTRVFDLPSGDYSLANLQDEIAVERKSIQDLFHTLGQQRERFERELIRLSSTTVAAVIVEAEWSTILHHPLEESRLSPKIVFRSVLAWQQQFPTIHWWFMPGRRPAEITTFRILERFARRRLETRKGKQKQEDVEQKQTP